MSKYFSLFQTESQYQAAKDNLDYPNVSLIDTTGDLHYATYTGKEVVNAPFGSILMAEVATNKLFYILDSEYNLTDYPLEAYKPIAVCIYDKASNANDQAVFMAVQWANRTTLGTPSSSGYNMHYGFNNVDLSAKVSGITDTGTNHVSSITINNAMKPFVTMDYSGSSIQDLTGDGQSAAFCSSWRFKTVGTSEGEWYLPSYYDLMKYQQNYSSINDIFTNIKNVAGSSYLNNAYHSPYKLCSSTESTTTNCLVIQGNGSWVQEQKTSGNTCWVRPVFISHVEEL